MIDQNSITVRYLGLSGETNLHTCSVFVGPIEGNSGCLVEDYKTDRLQEKVIRKVREYAGGDFKLVSRTQRESIFKRV